MSISRIIRMDRDSGSRTCRQTLPSPVCPATGGVVDPVRCEGVEPQSSRLPAPPVLLEVLQTRSHDSSGMPSG